MNAALIPLKAEDVKARLAARCAVLVDIRQPDEFARRHVQGALSHPLSAFDGAHLNVEPGSDVIFTCRTGMRTGANRERLAALVEGPVYVLDGGVDAWAAAGLPVMEDRKAPLELVRQTHIAAGSLVLAGVVLGALIHPAFYALSGLVGAGLALAGVTGFCGMARLLSFAPWNRVRA
jgi:rhodanese-related sulfurtransferase